jgi:CRP/FNR family nitrogen fixation transcriptional regulator
MHLSTHTDGIRRISTNGHVSASRTGAVDADALGQSMQLMGAMMTYRRDAEIFGENEPADYLYKVVSGTVRTYKILNDGRRQVSGLSFGK